MSQSQRGVRQPGPVIDWAAGEQNLAQAEREAPPNVCPRPLPQPGPISLPALALAPRTCPWTVPPASLPWPSGRRRPDSARL